MICAKTLRESHWTCTQGCFKSENCLLVYVTGCDMKDFAELVGVLLGDGSIARYEYEHYSTYYRVKVTVHAQEMRYAEHVAYLMSSVLGHTPVVYSRVGEQTIDILLFKKECVEFLLAQGLVSAPKWDRARVPVQLMNSNLGRYVLRGYFDTDGSVVLTNNNGTLYPRLELKISPSPMQTQLISLLDLFGFQFGVYQIGRGKVRVQLNGVSQLRKWIQEIGFSNEKHSEKARVFLN